MFEVGTALVERAKEDYGLVVCVVDVAEYEVDVDATERETNGSVSSTVWAVPASAGIRPCESHIFRFLKDARCSVRVVEVRLFKTGRLFNRVPMDTRRWGPDSDLANTAKEISKYIADSGSAEVTILASDEV